MPPRRSRSEVEARRSDRGSGDSARPPTVIVFLKAPRRGFVKTRLAATIGPAAATRVYRQLAERQVYGIPPGWPVEIHYTPRGSRRAMLTWLGPRPDYRLQAGHDLGERLAFAFTTAFRRGAKQVIAVGADCPDLDALCLRTTADALRTSDVVLGPAKDGGYYLIGLRRNLPGLFTDIPWSTAAVLRTTLRRARELRKSVHLLEEKEDIDDAESLRRYQLRQASWPQTQRLAST